MIQILNRPKRLKKMVNSKASSSDTGPIKQGFIAEFMRKRTQFVGKKKKYMIKKLYRIIKVEKNGEK